MPSEGQKQLPVINVSFHVAIQFAQWLSNISSKPMEIPHYEDYLLAVRAGRENWFKEELNNGRVNYHGTVSSPQPVDAFEPNPNGIIDLLGHAYDMCIRSKEYGHYTEIPFLRPSFCTKF